MVRSSITMPLEHAFYGFRATRPYGPEGNQWHFHEPLDHVRGRDGHLDE
jgi:uncharacterized glyoxalase superfamily protein PhnB